MMKLSNNLSVPKKQKIVLFDIDYTLFDTGIFKETQLTKHNIYEEVLHVLSDLSKKVILGIFSEGEIGFQKNKLKKTGIERFFLKEHIHIVIRKEENLKKILAKYKNNKLFLIDDKLTILYEAKTEFPYVFTIWVKRGEYAQKQKPIKDFVPDAIIGNLREVIPIIDSTN